MCICKLCICKPQNRNCYTDTALMYISHIPIENRRAFFFHFLYAIEKIGIMI